MPPVRFFSVSYRRLIFCALFSMGLYEIYWFYRNWKFVRDMEFKKISPFWRSIFTIIWCYPLFKKIYETAESRGYKASESYLWIAIIYIIVLLTHNLPGIFWLISMLSGLVLIPVQRAAHAANAAANADTSADSAWTRGQIIILAVSGVIWLLNLAGMLLPETPPVV